MSEHPWIEQAAPYALGALDETERSPFEAHLAMCEVCAKEVRELREVAGLLATAAAQPTPPATLRDRILADARKVRPMASAGAAAAPARASSAPDRSFASVAGARRSRGLPWIVAAAAAVVALVLGLQVRREREARVLAERSAAEARSAVDSVAVALRGRDSLIASLVAPGVEAVSVSGTGPAPSAKYFFDRGASRIVIAANALPPAAPGRTYQLWGIETGRAPVSLGTFNSDASGRALAIMAIPSGLRVAVTAVTDEPAGGSPQPTTTPFLAATWKAD